MTLDTHECRIDPGCQEILDELEARVRNSLGGRLQDFRILRQDGCLILQGRATSYYVKQLAQHHVQACSELPVLANDIEVV